MGSGLLYLSAGIIWLGCGLLIWNATEAPNNTHLPLYIRIPASLIGPIFLIIVGACIGFGLQLLGEPRPEAKDAR